jgi:histidyl-tRNA synthetase
MDIIGCDGIQAELDLICAVIEMLTAFGLSERDFSVGLSSRRLLNAFFKHMQIPPKALPGIYALLDKKSKISEKEYDSRLEALALSDKAADELKAFTCISNLKAVSKWESVPAIREAAGELRSLMEALTVLDYGNYMRLDLSIIRGLAYYTGPVFEVFDKDRRLRAIAGGGRYDNLLENLGGRRLSGVGFGIGDVVLCELLNSKKLLKAERSELDYYLANFSDSPAEMLSLAKTLRSRGRKVVYPLQPAKIKKQLSSAEETGAKKVVFVGSDRVLKGHYEVKDLLSRKQFILSVDEL